jgi:hypothetical protein
MAGLTAREMQYEAKIVYEALASADAPGYTDRQWSILLTQAQEKVVMEIINEGFDKDETNRRIISKLLTRESIDRPAVGFRPYIFNNSIQIELPEDYLHIAYDNVNGDISVKAVSHDFIDANIKNPFEKPYPEEFWRVVAENNVVIVTDGTTEVNKYNMVYIKKPEPIITRVNITIEGIEAETTDGQRHCKLDPIVHRRIVERAGRLAEAYVNNQAGYQLSMIEEKSIE